MKKNFQLVISICITLFAAAPANAQLKWSGGYRSGVELTNAFTVDPHEDFRQNMVWTNELFLSRSLTKRFEMESALRFNTRSASSSYREYITDYVSTQQYRTSHLSLQFTARYHVIKKKHYSIFGQLGSLLDYNYGRSESITYGAKPEVSFNYYKSLDIFSRINMGAGINYNISPNIFCSATFITGYKTDVVQYMGPDNYGYSSWAGNVLFGLGYRF